MQSSKAKAKMLSDSLTSTKMPRLGMRMPMEARSMRAGGQETSQARCGGGAPRCCSRMAELNTQTGTACSARMRYTELAQCPIVANTCSTTCSNLRHVWGGDSSPITP